MHDLVIPNIQDSVFAHIVHGLLVGGVVVYGWQAVSALVRKPRSVARALRKAVNAAWFAALLLVLTQANPVPSLRFAGVMAAVMIALSVLDKVASPEKGSDLLTSGPMGALGQEAERFPAAARVQRG